MINGLRTRATTTVIFAVAVTLCGCRSDTSKSAAQLPDSTAQAESGGRDSLVIGLAGVDGITVLDLLNADHDVDYRGTAVGAFVTRVDKAESGAEYFWLYSVNDSFPNTACDKWITSDGDLVVWHFRKIGR